MFVQDQPAPSSYTPQPVYVKEVEAEVSAAPAVRPADQKILLADAKKAARAAGRAEKGGLSKYAVKTHVRAGQSTQYAVCRREGSGKWKQLCQVKDKDRACEWLDKLHKETMSEEDVIAASVEYKRK